jgi:hypothetical protein
MVSFALRRLFAIAGAVLENIAVAAAVAVAAFNTSRRCFAGMIGLLRYAF